MWRSADEPLSPFSPELIGSVSNSDGGGAQSNNNNNSNGGGGSGGGAGGGLLLTPQQFFTPGLGGGEEEEEEQGSRNASRRGSDVSLGGGHGANACGGAASQLSQWSRHDMSNDSARGGSPPRIFFLITSQILLLSMRLPKKPSRKSVFDFDIDEKFLYKNEQEKYFCALNHRDQERVEIRFDEGQVLIPPLQTVWGLTSRQANLLLQMHTSDLCCSLFFFLVSFLLISPALRAPVDRRSISARNRFGLHFHRRRKWTV